MTSCPTCIEPYNESKRKLVNCAKCNFQCCLGCIKTYLVSTVQLPNCMNCKVEWNDELMRDVLSHHWITTKYAEKRKVLLFDIERSLLPATMEYVERQIILDQGAEDLEIVKPLMYMIKECASQFNHVGKSDLHLFENAKKLIKPKQQKSEFGSIQELLEETKRSLQESQEMGDEFHFTAGMAEGFGYERGGNVIPQGYSQKEIPKEVMSALTRDYSALMKKIDEKKGR